MELTRLNYVIICLLVLTTFSIIILLGKDSYTGSAMLGLAEGTNNIGAFNVPKKELPLHEDRTQAMLGLAEGTNNISAFSCDDNNTIDTITNNPEVRDLLINNGCKPIPNKKDENINK